MLPLVTGKGCPNPRLCSHLECTPQMLFFCRLLQHRQVRCWQPQAGRKEDGLFLRLFGHQNGRNVGNNEKLNTGENTNVGEKGGRNKATQNCSLFIECFIVHYVVFACCFDFVVRTCKNGSPPKKTRGVACKMILNITGLNTHLNLTIRFCIALSWKFPGPL